MKMMYAVATTKATATKVARYIRMLAVLFLDCKSLTCIRRVVVWLLRVSTMACRFVLLNCRRLTWFCKTVT